MVFGGADLKTLYFTGDGGLYSIRLKIPGRVRPGVTALRAASLASKRPALDPTPRDARGRMLSAGAASKTEALRIPARATR